MYRALRTAAFRRIGNSNDFSGAAVQLTRNYHFQLLNLKIGFTKVVNTHPESDKLYVSQVELNQNGAVKQICSGLRQHMPRERLQDQLVVVVDNMKKCKLRGQVSEGMLLCGEDELKGEVKLCTPAKFDMGLVGRSIVLQSNDGEIIAPTTRKIKTKEWEDISSRLRVGQEGRVVYTEENSERQEQLCVYDENSVPVPIVAADLPSGSPVK